MSLATHAGAFLAPIAVALLGYWMQHNSDPRIQALAQPTACVAEQQSIQWMNDTTDPAQKAAFKEAARLASLNCGDNVPVGAPLPTTK
jgi:hypothetical protein